MLAITFHRPPQRGHSWSSIPNSHLRLLSQLIRAERGRLCRYHAGMPKLLLNLRDVPDDEADDVRGFLESAGIEYYETPPSRWGISAGGIWIRDEGDVAHAQRLMAEYQHERQSRARAEHAEAQRSGTAETFLGVVRTQPLRVALALIAAALLLALMAAPALLLRQ
jgi:hypothetical protein